MERPPRNPNVNAWRLLSRKRSFGNLLRLKMRTTPAVFLRKTPESLYHPKVLLVVWSKAQQVQVLNHLGRWPRFVFSLLDILSHDTEYQDQHVKKNPVYLFYEVVSNGADGTPGDDGDKHYRCIHGSHKICTIKKSMRGNLNGEFFVTSILFIWYWFRNYSSD